MLSLARNVISDPISAFALKQKISNHTGSTEHIIDLVIPSCVKLLNKSLGSQ